MTRVLFDVQVFAVAWNHPCIVIANHLPDARQLMPRLGSKLVATVAVNMMRVTDFPSHLHSIHVIVFSIEDQHHLSRRFSHVLPHN